MRFKTVFPSLKCLLFFPAYDSPNKDNERAFPFFFSAPLQPTSWLTLRSIRSWKDIKSEKRKNKQVRLTGSHPLLQFGAISFLFLLLFFQFISPCYYSGDERWKRLRENDGKLRKTQTESQPTLLFFNSVESHEHSHVHVTRAVSLSVLWTQCVCNSICRAFRSWALIKISRYVEWFYDSLTVNSFSFSFLGKQTLINHRAWNHHRLCSSFDASHLLQPLTKWARKSSREN